MPSKTIVVGPWGGPGGNAWDDGSYTGVLKIELSYRDDIIGSFGAVYDLNGQPFAGPKRWSNLSSTTAKIELDFPDEYLVSISGYTSFFFFLASSL